ncbi:helicase SNF, partial [Halomonas sp. ATBC28]
EDYCEAFVQAAEDFAVMVAVEAGEIKANCSCPKLASFQKECQHIAAVLLEIKKFQLSGKEPATMQETNTNVSDDFFALFNQTSFPSPKKQRHFEKREVVPVEFLMKIIPVGSEANMFGIEIHLLSNKIKNIRQFLEVINAGNMYQ